MDRLVSKVLFNDCGTESEEICSIALWHQTRKGCWCSVPEVWVTSLGPKIKLWGHRMIKGMTNKNLPFFFFCCFLVKHWVLLALQTPKNLSKWKTLRGSWHFGWITHIHTEAVTSNKGITSSCQNGWGPLALSNHLGYVFFAYKKDNSLSKRTWKMKKWKENKQVSWDIEKQQDCICSTGIRSGLQIVSTVASLIYSNSTRVYHIYLCLYTTKWTNETSYPPGFGLG